MGLPGAGQLRDDSTGPLAVGAAGRRDRARKPPVTGARGEKNPPVEQATRHLRVVPEHLDQDLPGAESVVHQPGVLFQMVSRPEPS